MPYTSPTKYAFHLLQTVILEEPGQVAAAWSVLVDDAGTICARRQRRDRRQLIALLEGAHIKVKPPAKDDRWFRRLDFVDQLLEKHLPDASLAQLTELEKELGSTPTVDPLVFYRIATQRASACWQLGRGEQALESARRALDYQPSGVRALRLASYGAMLMKDLDAALAFAERAVVAHPEDGSAWGTRARVAAARGEPLPVPKASVAEATEYRKALIEVALMQGNHVTILELTAGLLRDGERSPAILFHRANSLIDAPSGIDGLSDAQRYSEVERLVTEVIDSLAGSTDELALKGLVLRANARRLLGRAAEADADIAAARELRPDDVDAIAAEAMVRIQTEDLLGALELLRFPSVNEVPELIALRARLSAMTNDDAGARKDLESALSQAQKSGNGDQVRFLAADVALLLQDSELAQQILDGVSTGARTDVRNLSIRGRLAFSRGDEEEGAKYYREAVELHSHHRPLLLAELGSNLLIAGRADEAVAVYSELAPAEIPSDALRTYAAALIRTNTLKLLQQLLDRMSAEGPLPAWALAAATDVALRQEDPEAAIAHLLALVERQGTHVGARIELARLLMEAGRVSDASPHVDVIIREPNLSPSQQMQVAQLLQAAGRDNEALPIAHAAYRAAPGDAPINRAFIMITLLGDGGPSTASFVEVDTYVRMTDEKGEPHEYTVVRSGEVDPRRREISLRDANAMGLIGRAVGEKITRKAGWQASEWKVEEILPVIVREAQHAAIRYEHNFPGEPFFLTSFNVGDGSGVMDFAPIVASLESRQRAVDAAFALYREQGFPLGMMVRLLGGSIDDVMGHVCGEESGVMPLLVEWPRREDYETSRAVARAAKRIVITASAIKTAADTGLLDILESRYQLIAPRSLINELHSELAEAQRMVRDGHSVIGRAGDGLRMDELPSGAPALIRREEALRHKLEFLERAASIEPRPLERIVQGDSDAGSLRDMVGRSSYDALVLALHHGVPLLADDLGLRRLDLGGVKPDTCSTVTLLEALAEEGVIASVERDRHLTTLAHRGYVFIKPTRGLLISAVQRVREIEEKNVQAVLGTLGFPGIEPGEAARLTVQVARSQLVATVQVMNPGRIVGMALGAMAATWPPRLCAQSVARAALVEFALYPQASRDIMQVCRAFLADVIATPISPK